MPTPKSGESRKDFVSRCVSAKIKEGKHPNTEKGRKAAVGECGGIYDGKKSARDYTLREQTYLVQDSWSTQFGDQEPYSWCSSVYGEYAIVSVMSRFLQVPYTIEGPEVTFDLEKAQFVEHEWVSSERRLIQSPIRALGKNTYQCYGMLFGDQDHRDAYGTWFDENTEYCLEWYKSWPWLYHHTHNRFIGVRKIGDWFRADIDDKGIFFQGELDQHQEYLDEIQVLLDEEKVLFPSSGTLAYAASPPRDDGYISVWPIAELSSTVAPADFRQSPISERAAEAIRCLGR